MGAAVSFASVALWAWKTARGSASPESGRIRRCAVSFHAQNVMCLSLENAAEEHEHATLVAIRRWLEYSDQKAAAWLVEHYRPVVSRVISRMLPEATQAEEAAHDVMAHLFTQMRRYRPTHAFAAWVTTLTRNLVLRRIRTQRRYQRRVDMAVSLETLHEAGIEPMDTDSPGLIERRDAGVFCLGQLRRLPTLARRVFWEQCMEGEAFPVVAKRHHITACHARVLAHRTRQTLRRMCHEAAL